MWVPSEQKILQIKFYSFSFWTTLSLKLRILTRTQLQVVSQKFSDETTDYEAIDTVSKSEPKDDLSDKDYAVPKSFDDTTILDVVDNKIEQITTKLAELQCRLKDSIIWLHRAALGSDEVSEIVRSRAPPLWNRVGEKIKNHFYLSLFF